jgi:Fic family protein
MTPIEQVATAIAEHGSPNWIAYVPSSIRRQVPYDIITALLANARKTRPDDKHRMILNHIVENPNTETTTAQVAQIMQVSLPTARSFITDNPQHFTDQGRGKWMIRNHQEKKK